MACLQFFRLEYARLGVSKVTETMSFPRRWLCVGSGSLPVFPFSRSVVSDSLQPQESQHARPPCPSPASGVHSDSCPSSQWCHPAISSSVVPFSSRLQSFPASGSFPRSQLFASGGWRIGAYAHIYTQISGGAVVKNSAASVGNLETHVWSLGREDPLEEETETPFSILAWRVPWTEEPGGLQSTGSQRVRHDWATEAAHI